MRRAAGLAEKLQHRGFAELIQQGDASRHREAASNHHQ